MICLVVEPNPSEKYDGLKVSWDKMTFPIYGKDIWKNVPNHQPVILQFKSYVWRFYSPNLPGRSTFSWSSSVMNIPSSADSYIPFQPGAFSLAPFTASFTSLRDTAWCDIEWLSGAYHQTLNQWSSVHPSYNTHSLGEVFIFIYISTYLVNFHSNALIFYTFPIVFNTMFSAISFWAKQKTEP